jgi:hypothetical protein
MSKGIDLAIRMAEKHADRELNSKISARMKASANDIGHVDSLRAVVLSHVTTENYVRATESLRDYVDSKHEYPKFAGRVEKYVAYCGDLVAAIKVKRSFPGIQSLSMSKQQELLDRSLEHFEDLKNVLKKIEAIEREIRLEDVRSTIWVVKAIVYSVFAMLVIAFLLEASRGLVPTLYTVLDYQFGIFSDWIFKRFGL